MEKMYLTDLDLKTIELTGLPQDFFAINRKNYFDNLEAMLLGLQKNSIIVLQGGKEVPRFDTDVVHYHFNQEANFYYLTGVIEPDCQAILEIATRNITIYISLPTDDRTKVFMKVPTLEELSKKYGLTFKLKEDLNSDIKDLNPDKIYLLNGTNSDSHLSISSAELDFPKPMEAFEGRKDYNGLIYEILADTRTRKSQNEIGLLSFINNATVEGHVEVLKTIKPGMNERDAENIFFNHMRAGYYARIWAYPCICGTGGNSSTLHYEKNNVPLKDGDLLLIDMGIRLGGYTSDVTSTIPVNGKFTQQQKDIYNLVLKANRSVMAELKAGVSWPDMHTLAERVILEGLVALNILNKNDINEMLNNRVAYYFMPHGLGHFLGLEVHDVGGYLSFTPKRLDQVGLNKLRTTRTLTEGNCITVEPGIYFIRYLIDKAYNDQTISKYFNKTVLETYMNLGGVRIEDDVIITYNSCVNLTAKLPRTVEEIEQTMKK
jgi:Xaa-Pro dipeptidase